MSPSNLETRERRRSIRAAMVFMPIIAVAWGVSAPWVYAQDRTAAWLESQGLDELLARHLELELDAARGDGSDRSRVAGRLARTYARLLRTVEDEERRASIVERGRLLIEIASPEDAGELRVALVRNRYIRASQVMEDDRIGVAEPEAVKSALAELEAVAEEFESVRRMALDEVGLARRARGMYEETRLQSALDLAAAAGLLEGWSRYYLGRATGDRRQFERAQIALGAVLQGESPIPDEDEVSFDLQAVEGFANAVLANAMITSALESTPVARPWFDRLDMTITHENVRRTAPGWRLAALLDASAFDEAMALFQDLVERARVQGDAALPVSWIRLAAVAGLRDGDRGSDALALAQSALAALAAQGELGQVRSLAEQFGLEAMGDRGFVFAYVRGLLRHRAAVEARDAGDAAGAARHFAASVELLQLATREDDATRYPEAAASATMLIGWSLLELGDATDAADAFEDAAGRMAGDQRADALWGAIVSLDRVVQAQEEGAEGALARRDALIGRFLDAFPADDRSPSLVIRRIAQQEDPDSESIEVLLGVPQSHPTWEIARRRATQALYRSFRRATDPEARGESGRRMLAVTDELLGRDRSESAMKVGLKGLDGMLLRQAAEVATDERVHEIDRANRYLGQLERAMEQGAFADVLDLPNEILYRRLGLALGDGDFEFAGRLLDQMPAVAGTPDADEWTRLAALRIHQAADDRIRDGAVTVDIARSGAAAGTRYLEMMGGIASDTGDREGEGGVDDRFAALDQERLLPIAARVAAARAAVFEAAGDRRDGEEALAWYVAILERRPLDGSILQSTGRVAEALGEHEVALDAFRRLVRGALEGSELWWRGKVGQIRALLNTDPAAARVVFDQLKTLRPELGPEPWRSELRGLAIDLESTRDATATGESGGDA